MTNHNGIYCPSCSGFIPGNIAKEKKCMWCDYELQYEPEVEEEEDLSDFDL